MGDEPKANTAQHSKLGRRKLILLSVSLLILAILGLVFIRNLIDFPVYYAAGRSLVSGRTDLYSPDFARGQVMDFRYPPLFLLAFYPLWLVPYPIAAYSWYLLSVLEIVGCAIAVKRSLLRAPQSPAVWIVVALVVAQYYVTILHYGNAHLLAMCLLFGAYFFCVRGKAPTAALLMSLAITLKLTPVLILPYFALKKQWRFLILTAVFTVLLNLAPAGYFGFDANTDLLKTWYGHVVVNQEFHEVNGPINLSLKGQLRRYLSAIDYSQRVEGDTDYPSVNVATLATQQADRIWMVTALLVSLAVLYVIWWTSRAARSVNSNASQAAPEAAIASLGFGLMICLMLLIGPLTSKIYFVALLWPVASLASAAFSSARSSARFPKWSLGVVAIANAVLPLLPGRSTQRLLLVLGVDFYLNCLVMIAVGYCLILAVKTHRQAAEPQTRAPSASRTS